jgi:hypothetical protein
MAKSTGPIDLLRRLRATSKASKTAKMIAPELKAATRARAAKRAEAARKASVTTSPGTKELREIKVTAPKTSKSALNKFKANRAAVKEKQEKKKMMKFLFGVNLPISTTAAAAVTEAVTRVRGEKSTKPKKINTTNKLKKVKIKNK